MQLKIWKNFKREIIKEEAGQSTVEFAIIVAALLAVIVCLGVLLNVLDNGLFVEHALDAASHNVDGGALGNLGDLFCY